MSPNDVTFTCEFIMSISKDQHECFFLFLQYSLGRTDVGGLVRVDLSSAIIHPAHVSVDEYRSRVFSNNTHPSTRWYVVHDSTLRNVTDDDERTDLSLDFHSQIGIVCAKLLLTIAIGCILYMSLSRRWSSPATPPCVCRNHLNEPVDWFIIYKLPRLSNSVDPSIRNGTGYIYLDSSSSLDQWHFSSLSISSPSSLTGLTLAPLYGSNAHSYLFYNDQPPNKSVSLIYGHSKGVLAFGDEIPTGFWLIHSVPHFPAMVQQGYQYPDSGSIDAPSEEFQEFLRSFRSHIRSNHVLHHHQFLELVAPEFR